uniref:Uncharacterized protein n=1 Tax=Magallana gigas TaxID=29159 RepID=K1PSW8_MAGGI
MTLLSFQLEERFRRQRRRAVLRSGCKGNPGNPGFHGPPGNPGQQGEKGDKGDPGTKDKKETEEILVQEVFPEKGETKGKLDHVGFQELWDHLVTQDNPDHVPAGAITYHLVFFSVF